jgi:uncharacterized membrane protein
MTLQLHHLYLLCGVLFAWLAWRHLRVPSTMPVRRAGNVAFWSLLALVFFAGERLPAAAVGAIAIALALLAGVGLTGRAAHAERPRESRVADALKLRHRLFVPALAIPLVTVAGVLGLKHVHIAGAPLLDPAQVTLTSLGLACVVALAIGCAMTRQSPARAMDEGARLLDTIGWAMLLPLMLATLGSVFAATGVGDATATLMRAIVPADNRLAAVIAYTFGMALFTMVMGNAFAAFPVITAGIGLPLLVGVHGASAAPMAAIGMLSGYCGTLLTPMAANFNLVPAALLELPDRYGVIRAQAATGLMLLVVNTLLIWLLAF